MIPHGLYQGWQHSLCNDVSTIGHTMLSTLLHIAVYTLLMRVLSLLV